MHDLSEHGLIFITAPALTDGTGEREERKDKVFSVALRFKCMIEKAQSNRL